MLTLVLLCAVITSFGAQGWGTTGQPSCRYNCGYNLGACSCSNSCTYDGSCCFDYHSYCARTTESPPEVSTQGRSCRYNCGAHLGSCSCSDSCQYYGNCCYDYHSYCPVSTMATTTPTTTLVTPSEPHSCLYNCGYHLSGCSCTSSCQYYGDCCHDYYSYCDSTTTTSQTTEQPSCRYNCGHHMGSCSCSDSCQYYGNCCNDYYNYCSYTTMVPTPTENPSCRYNCGYSFGSCSCSSYCPFYGNCCPDFYSYCDSATTPPHNQTTEQPSCRYNCGHHMGSCSCSSSCQYYGNCCNDYYNYCSYTNTTMVPTPTENPSCRYNCGFSFGSCSCSNSCEYSGNCCHDYYSFCYYHTTSSPGTHCGGSLFGSGSFSSPNYPYYYPDNSNCVWQIRTSPDQSIYLTFSNLELENCCVCDYINVYDGPSVGSRLLGNICYVNSSQSSFHSSSNYLTVLFRTDHSVVGRGFNAEFTSSLSSGLGRVDCSSDNMNIVISRSYLSSVGIDGNDLYLDDQYCRPEISYYNVVFRFPINTCGTVRQFDQGRIVYTNALRAFSSNYGEITRQSLFKLNVSCRMEQDSVSQIIYEVNHHENVSISGSGRFNTSMAFYTSSNFYYRVTQVPYRVRLNQDLYVQVSLRRGDSTLVVFLDTCVASPSPHDFHSRSYDLIRNGCRVDSTFYSYSSGTSPYARFRFKAFQFLRATDHVYLQCTVLICPASDYSSRCRRGCTRRVARDVGSEHDTETVVLGPIQLQKSKKLAKAAQQKTKG